MRVHFPIRFKLFLFILHVCKPYKCVNWLIKAITYLCQAKDIKLNQSKLRLNRQSTVYMGDDLTSSGLRPHQQKIEAILKISASTTQSSHQMAFIIIIIIIALDNAHYKMLHKLKSVCFIRKKQLGTSASSCVSQKSLD